MPWNAFNHGVFGSCDLNSHISYTVAEMTEKAPSSNLRPIRLPKIFEKLRSRAEATPCTDLSGRMEWGSDDCPNSTIFFLDDPVREPFPYKLSKFRRYAPESLIEHCRLWITLCRSCEGKAHFRGSIIKYLMPDEHVILSEFRILEPERGNQTTVIGNTLSEKLI
jgi:hypothetical protein